MKLLKIIFGIYLSMTFITSCEVDGIDSDTSFVDSATSTNLSNIFKISNNNSGQVKITPLADGFSKAIVKFGHGTNTATLNPGENTTHAYPEGAYTVAIDYVDIAGKITPATYPLSVTYRAPENLSITISGEARVKATALYAKSFSVFYGDVANEVATPMALDQELPPHTYPQEGGPFVLKVVALSGGAATVSESKTMFGFPINFESTQVNYFFGTFGGGQQFATVDNPDKSGLNTSAKVGKFTRGHEGWSGTYSPLNIPINFAYGRKIKVLVYNPIEGNVGASVNIELEYSISGPDNGVAIMKVPCTTYGQWEELVFDFNSISGIPDNAKFTQLVLRFNDSKDGAGDAIYFDNFSLIK